MRLDALLWELWERSWLLKREREELRLRLKFPVAKRDTLRKGADVLLAEQRLQFSAEIREKHEKISKRACKSPRYGARVFAREC